jgi:hypothetical protein
MLGTTMFKFGWEMSVISDTIAPYYEVAILKDGKFVDPPEQLAEHFGFDGHGICRGLRQDEVVQLRADMKALMPYEVPRVPDWVK